MEDAHEHEVFDGGWQSANRCLALWGTKSGRRAAPPLTGPLPWDLPLALSLRPFAEEPLTLNAGDAITRLPGGQVRLVLHHPGGPHVLTL